MNRNTSAGMKNTWNAKNRLSVAPPIVSPARMKRARSGPSTGMRPAWAAPTMTDQTAVWSHLSNCPVNASASVSSRRTAPLSQLSSRGNLSAAMR